LEEIKGKIMYKDFILLHKLLNLLHEGLHFWHSIFQRFMYCCVNFSINLFLAISLPVIIHGKPWYVHFLKLLSFYRSYISSPAVRRFGLFPPLLYKCLATRNKIFYPLFLSDAFLVIYVIIQQRIMLTKV